MDKNKKGNNLYPWAGNTSISWVKCGKPQKYGFVYKM
jgi:hypothetical protein